MISGGLWLLLWKSKARIMGLAPIAAGMIWAAVTPAPDILITGDGRHLAVRDNDGKMHLLRARSGDYIRDVLAERLGTLTPLEDIDAAKGAKCGRDLCVMTLNDGKRDWRIAATRSDYLLPWQSFIKTCQSVDIIVSSRKLPRACTARWITADRLFLQKTGGLAITLGSQKVERAFRHHDDHPWRRAPTPPTDIQ
jgi:competence protein ComEC